MSKGDKAKQNAMIQACKMAGFDVTRRHPSQPKYSIVLTDDMGSKYNVVKGVVIRQVRASHTTAIKANVAKVAPRGSKATDTKQMKAYRAKTLRAKKKAIG